MTPLSPPPDGKDWTWVLERPCPDCGFDPSALATAEIGRRITDAIAAMIRAVRAPGSGERPRPDVWSPLEYGCHVRDVCRVTGARISLMRSRSDPIFANWDQDATALAERYWTQDPATVADELAAEGERIVSELDSLTPEELQRPGRRDNGSQFTLESLSRYVLHDLEHHVHDVEPAAPPT